MGSAGTSTQKDVKCGARVASFDFQPLCGACREEGGCRKVFGPGACVLPEFKATTTRTPRRIATPKAALLWLRKAGRGVAIKA